MGRCKQGGMELYYKYNIKNENGIVKKQPKISCNSFVANFAKIISIHMLRYPDTIVDMTNVTRDIYYNSQVIVSSVAGQTATGMIVGTDNTAVTINDYALGAKIAHGTGAGELQYSSTTVSLPVSTDYTTTTTITRVFSNDSGGLITVNEIGLASRWYVSGEKGMLIVRDIPSPIAIGNGEQLTINYLLQTTV